MRGQVGHDDEGDEMSELSEKIKQVIETEPVVLFMKGTPEFVMCGNSNRALEALRRIGAPVSAVDILVDPEIRGALSEISGWPTIPQLFIGGELVGGADIVEEIERNGDLLDKLMFSVGPDFRVGREEKVIAVT
jgi:monothiol glutaredoxin